MRLAVFTNQFPAPVNTFFARDMRALIECGVQIEVFAFYPPEERYWTHVPACLGGDVLPRARVHHSSPRSLLRAAAPLPFRQWARFASAATPIIGAAARYGAGPAAKSAYAAAYAWAWSRATGRPEFDHVLAYWGNYAATSAYLFHRLTHPHVPFSMFAHARVDLYRHPAWLAPKFLYADNIFLVCEYNRRYIADKYPGIYPRIAAKIHVHHLGLPLEEISFEPDGRDERTLVAVGRLEPLKGLDNLIEAAAALRARGTELKVEIVGVGEQESELRELAVARGMEQLVTFRGLLSSDDTLKAIRRATVLVHPSIAPDAMPTVLKEALAVGTPAVASDLAGATEILDAGACGLLVPANDVAALVDAIDRLLQSAPLRRELARRGRERAETMFDLWRNGAALADRLRATLRGAGQELARAG